MSKFGFQIGTPGKKYGLIKPKPQPNPKLKSVFSLDDTEETVNEEIIRAQQLEKAKRKAALEYEKALEEDPTAFDYDEVYEQMKSHEQQERAELRASKQSSERKPRYVKEIIERSKERKTEQEIIYFKKLRKELEQEQEDFGEKPVFITKTYKEKMQKEKEWEEEQKKKDELEKDVTKHSDLTGFYSGLLNNSMSRYKAGNMTKSTPSESKRESVVNQHVENEKENHFSESASSQKGQQAKISEEELEQERLRKEQEEKEYHRKRKQMELEEQERRKKILEEEEKKKAEEKRKKEEEYAKKMARRNDDKSIQDARARYLARKAARDSENQQ